MQGEDFNVRLEALATFQETLEDTLAVYEVLVEQLKTADPATAKGGVESLLGEPVLPGSTRAYEASRVMLGNYTALYSKITDAHSVIIARLQEANIALADNRAEYARQEAAQKAVYHELLLDLPDAARGGDRGTAGQK